jgi:hypothetical protein
MMINFENVASEQEERPGDERPLADVNFRNTVIYYRDELRRIDAGELATQHLKDRQRKALVKAGILKRVYGRGGCRLRLSNEARRLLGELDDGARQMS